jgi:hypothetical protein
MPTRFQFRFMPISECYFYAMLLKRRENKMPSQYTQ